MDYIRYKYFMNEKCSVLYGMNEYSEYECCPVLYSMNMNVACHARDGT